MNLVTLRGVTHGFGAEPLLDGVALEVDAGERVVLVGRNGSGKSTLMHVVAAAIAPDGGEVRRDPAVRVAYLPQDASASIEGTVREVVASGLAELGSMLDEHARLGAETHDPRALDALAEIQHGIDAAGGWDLDVRVARTLSGLGLDGERAYASLSGGLRRRTLLARALVAEPDLLLLDEPTNHLDVDAIEWIEDLLSSWRGGVLFTTHDRRLVERVATRIVELDRGALTSWPGDWKNYLRRRDERLAAEESADARFDRRLAEEEIWIRQGIKARRTRNEGRVRRLEAMRRERAVRRASAGRASFSTQAAPASGRRVIEARAVRFGYEAQPIVDALDVLVERGDRIGIIGPNGSGKTTLLRLLLGQVAPDAGEIVMGTRLEIAYFDQHREVLDDAATVIDSVADGTGHVIVEGRRRHAIGYLGDFLFEPSRARQPVAALSGGERARLLLARLFARPSNLIVMDEPTNDLDVETLELLEERLEAYPGTLLLVSHDRAFLDNVVTSTLVLEGAGRVGEYVGGYADWIRQRPAPESKAPAAKSSPPAPEPRAEAPRRRLGFNEQRELATLPKRIESLEAEIASLHARLGDPALYRDEADQVAAIRARLGSVEAELESAFERWSELESIAGA